MLVVTLSDRLLIGAAFFQIALTLGLMIWMGILRYRAVSTRFVQVKEVALSSENYPEQARKIGNATSNQFELPILFLFGVLLTLILGGTNGVEVTLAWIFVGFRFVHAYVFTTSNNVPNRFLMFVFSLITLIAFLLEIFVRLMFFGVS